MTDGRSLAAHRTLDVQALYDGFVNEPIWVLQRFREIISARFGPLALAYVTITDAQASMFAFLDRDGAIVRCFDGTFDDPASAAPIGLTVERGVAQLRCEQPEFATAIHHGTGVLVPILLGTPDRYLLLFDAEQALDGDAVSDFANLVIALLVRRIDQARLEQANAWINRELDEIRELQRLLHPPDLSVIDGLDAALWFEEYRFAGGDYFDLMALTHHAPAEQQVPGRDHFGCMVADVSGHGPSGGDGGGDDRRHHAYLSG